MQSNNNSVISSNSFGVVHIPKEIKTFINRPLSSALQNKNIKTYIFIIQAYDSIMCGYFCIGFIDFMLARKNIFLNYDIVLNYFMSNV